MACEPYLLAAVRTPRGKGSPKGALHAITSREMVMTLLGALPRPEHVDDLILGCANPIEEQAGNLARDALLAAGWSTPGLMVNRYCASGLEAAALAASRVRAEDASLVIAGGVESVSRITAPSNMRDIPAAADRVAALEGITREECDAYAHATRQKAAAAPRNAAIIPLGGLDRDENIGHQPTREELAALPALLGGVHTRGNSPSLADAAALVMIGDAAAARSLGRAPRAKIVATASVAADPVTMLTAGQAAVERVLARAGLRSADIAVFEFAEAFGALCVRFMRALDVGHDRFNPNGGTIARGHAYGATGAALLVDALEELERRQGRYAIIGVSGAAGLGTAMLIERT